MSDPTEPFGIKSALHKIMDTWPLPEGEPIPGKTYIADGWQYLDLPRMTPEWFDKFITIAGEENIVWLTMANYGETRRGQILLSPKGQQRFSEYTAAQKSTPSS